jgi:hypothetical protein
MNNTIDTAAQTWTFTDISRPQSPEPNFDAGQQLSLCFGAPFRHRRRTRRQQILQSQAAFWFGTMRRIVDNAVEWKPAPLARREQPALDLRRISDVHIAR